MNIKCLLCFSFFFFHQLLHGINSAFSSPTKSYPEEVLFIKKTPDGKSYNVIDHFYWYPIQHKQSTSSTMRSNYHTYMNPHPAQSYNTPHHHGHHTYGQNGHHHGYGNHLYHDHPTHLINHNKPVYPIAQYPNHSPSNYQGHQYHHSVYPNGDYHTMQ